MRAVCTLLIAATAVEVHTVDTEYVRGILNRITDILNRSEVRAQSALKEQSQANTNPEAEDKFIGGAALMDRSFEKLRDAIQEIDKELKRPGNNDQTNLRKSNDKEFDEDELNESAEDTSFIVPPETPGEPTIVLNFNRKNTKAIVKEAEEDEEDENLSRDETNSVKESWEVAKLEGLHAPGQRVARYTGELDPAQRKGAKMAAEAEEKELS